MQNFVTVDLDLLIVGGGIQGLTLLHHYHQEGLGSALLVTRDALGAGETLHSHGYLHRGYFLSEEEAGLLPSFVESFEWWNSWMGECQIRYAEDNPVFFDLASEQFDKVTANWRKANLPFEAVTRLPTPLQGGIYSRALQRRLLRVHDRLIPAWRIIRSLSAPLQDRLLQGEITGAEWDPRSNRIRECTVTTAGGTIRIRPKFVVLAAGRENQILLRRVVGPGGIQPFRDKLIDTNVIRDVPMILIQGPSLPSLNGWFFQSAPITMMCHPRENEPPMWVVTLMAGHQSYRGDFRGEEKHVDSATVRKTLEVLWSMVPGLKEISEELQFSSYIGGKIDHPEGLKKWFIGDCGIKNMRFVWPVLWGMAHNASRELIRTLKASATVGPPAFGSTHYSLLEQKGVRFGVEVGEEFRLSSRRVWHKFEEWKKIHQLSL